MKRYTCMNSYVFTISSLTGNDTMSSKLTRTKVKNLKQNGDAAAAPRPPLLQLRLILVLVPWLKPSETRNEINHLYEIICLSDFAAAYCRFGASARTSCLHLPLAMQPPHPSPPATADCCFGFSARTGCLHDPLASRPPPPSPPAAADCCFVALARTGCLHLPLAMWPPPPSPTAAAGRHHSIPLSLPK